MIEFTILGQPCSKSNTSQIVTLGKGEEARSSITKSKAAKTYERDALRQIPARARQRLTGPVRVSLVMYYANERSDMDESLVLDCLQDRWKNRRRDKHAEGGMTERVLLQHGVYRNDRQVRERHVWHRIDPRNPRVVVRIEPLQAQQLDLDIPDAPDPF
jgi:Holliday junction resolvase RusA-like endonuclease